MGPVKSKRSSRGKFLFGRALVAHAISVVTQVQLRKGDQLYINDGIYGSLSDAGALGFRYPVRLIRPTGPTPSDALVGFSFFGPHHHVPSLVSTSMSPLPSPKSIESLPVTFALG